MAVFAFDVAIKLPNMGASQQKVLSPRFDNAILLLKNRSRRFPNVTSNKSRRVVKGHEVKCN